MTTVESSSKSGATFLWLELTGRCQLTCTHCYAERAVSRTRVRRRPQNLELVGGPQTFNTFATYPAPSTADTALPVYHRPNVATGTVAESATLRIDSPAS